MNPRRIALRFGSLVLMAPMVGLMWLAEPYELQQRSLCPGPGIGFQLGLAVLPVLFVVVLFVVVLFVVGIFGFFLSWAERRK